MVYKTDFDYAQEEHHQEIVELLKKGVNKANKSANVIIIENMTKNESSKQESKKKMLPKNRKLTNMNLITKIYQTKFSNLNLIMHNYRTKSFN